MFRLALSISLFCLCLFSPFLVKASEKESAFDRVMRTGTIRCGYYLWPPVLVRDPNSGKMSGIGVDIFEEIGRLLSLKIEWAEEVGNDTMFEGYKTGRYDLLCAPVGATPARARVAEFTRPVFFSPFRMYAKAGDTRFDNALEKANDPSVRYAQMDGEFGAIIRSEVFPRTQSVSLPAMSSPAELMMTLATGKADITVTDPVQFILFNRKNPGKIHEVAGKPVRVISLTYSVPPGEERFKSVLNVTLDTLLEDGFIDRVLKQEPEYDQSLLRPSRPYEEK